MWRKVVLAAIVLAGLSSVGRECAGNLTLGVSVDPSFGLPGIAPTATVYLAGDDASDYFGSWGLSYADVLLTFNPAGGNVPAIASVAYSPNVSPGANTFDPIASGWDQPDSNGDPGTIELFLVSSFDGSGNPEGVMPTNGQLDLATITFQPVADPGTWTITPSVAYNLPSGFFNPAGSAFSGLVDGSPGQEQISFDPISGGDIITPADLTVVPEASTMVGIVTGLCGFLAIFAVRRWRARPQPATP